MSSHPLARLGTHRRSVATLAATAVAGAALASCSSGPAAAPVGDGHTSPARIAAAMRSPLVAVDASHGGHFLVQSTGARFVLRGFDYQPIVTVPGSTDRYVNVTFEPSYYDHAKVAAMVATWERDGYNTTRVFLNPTQIGRPDGQGLSSGYLANLADFVTTAAAHDVRTMITIGSPPTHGGYVPRTAPRTAPSFGLYNEDYLDPNFIAAQRRYLRDLVAGLRAKGAPLEDVLWELKGEQDWNLSAAPLDRHSGRVTTADGKTYDMASAVSRTAMERNNLLHWTNTLSATLHRLVPHSLVGVGLFPPSVHHRTSQVTPGPLFSSATTSDFVDVHVYPNVGPESVQMASFGASATTKPVIMGEFGVTRKHPVAAATTALVSWQQDSCHIAGVSVSGWLLWNWNSKADAEFWYAKADGGRIAHALAPVNRPDPCG